MTWSIERDDFTFSFAVSQSVLTERLIGSHADDYVRFDRYGQDERTWRYVATFRPAPVVLQRPEYLGVFYSPMHDLSARPIRQILYHDINVRLIVFGHPQGNDYLMVLRKR